MPVVERSRKNSAKPSACMSTTATGLPQALSITTGRCAASRCASRSGPKDVEKNSVAMARRDRPGKAGKTFVAQEGLVQTVTDTLLDIQAALLERATAFRDEHIFEVAITPD